MDDQANDLRRLVRHHARSANTEAGGGAARQGRLLAVTGGKGGVGTTTVAVHLAAALARGGVRTALVDADPGGGDVAVLCGLEPGRSLADVTAARRAVWEVLRPGPAGTVVAPGPFATASFVDEAHRGQERILSALESLRTRFDFLIVDSGNDIHRTARRIWRRADAVLAVTTVEPASVLDTYGAIKVLTASASPAAIHLLVNRVADAAAAEDVVARLRRACLRFLGVRFRYAGFLPVDAALAPDGRSGPAVPLAERSAAADRFRRLAARLVEPACDDDVNAAGHDTGQVAACGG